MVSYPTFSTLNCMSTCMYCNDLLLKIYYISKYMCYHLFASQNVLYTIEEQTHPIFSHTASMVMQVITIENMHICISACLLLES